jgi:hypothetical protein
MDFLLSSVLNFSRTRGGEVMYIPSLELLDISNLREGTI